MIRCILFDVDDTLMDYHEAETAIFRRLFAEQGRAIDAPALDDLWEKSWLYWNGRGLSTKMGGIYPVEIIAHTLRMLSQGVKVCLECSVMALDAGAIPYGEKVVAVGGTGHGADTACTLTPAGANAVLDCKIHEILCKPS